MISATRFGLTETIQFFKLEVSYTYHYALETAQITVNDSIICKNIYPVFVTSIVVLLHSFPNTGDTNNFKDKVVPRWRQENKFLHLTRTSEVHDPKGSHICQLEKWGSRLLFFKLFLILMNKLIVHSNCYTYTKIFWILITETRCVKQS